MVLKILVCEVEIWVCVSDVKLVCLLWDVCCVLDFCGISYNEYVSFFEGIYIYLYECGLIFNDWFLC